MIRVYDAISSKKTRAVFGESIHTKRNEIKSITGDKKIQTSIFKEFLAKELKRDDIINAGKVLRELDANKQANREKSTEQEILKNIVAHSLNEEEIVQAKNKLLEMQNQEDIDCKTREKEEIIENIKFASLRKIGETGSWDILEYMKTIEKQKYCSFKKEDFEEVVTFFLGELEKALTPICNIFASWREDGSDFFTDYKKYLRDAMNPDMGQKIIYLLSDKKLIGLKNALFGFFYELNKEYNSGLVCSQKELNEIFYAHTYKFTELLSFTGDLRSFNEIKEKCGRNKYDSMGHKRLKMIVMMKGDVESTISIAKERESYELGSKDLQVLSINKEREEEKEALVYEIIKLIQAINKIAGREIFNPKDYNLNLDSSSRNVGEIGKRLMTMSIGEIEGEYKRFEELLSTQKKQRNELVGTKILGALLHKPGKEG